MKNKFETLNIKQILSAIVSKIVPIILCTVLCAGTSLVYYSFFVDDRYSATVSIIVDNRSSTDTSEETLTRVKSTSDITASRMLVDTYIAIFNNASFRESVARKVNESSSVILEGNAPALTPAALKDMLTMSAVNATEILQIKASTTIPQLSVDICYAIVDVAQVVLRNTMDTLTVNSVEGSNILLPTEPDSPDAIVKTMIAALLGFCLACAAVIVLYVLDDTIRGSVDLSDICGYPILGEIPCTKAETTQGIRRLKK